MVLPFLRERRASTIKHDVFLGPKFAHGDLFFGLCSNTRALRRWPKNTFFWQKYLDEKTISSVKHLKFQENQPPPLGETFVSLFEKTKRVLRLIPLVTNYFSSGVLLGVHVLLVRQKICFLSQNVDLATEMCVFSPKTINTIFVSPLETPWTHLRCHPVSDVLAKNNNKILGARKINFIVFNEKSDHF